MKNWRRSDQKEFVRFQLFSVFTESERDITEVFWKLEKENIVWIDKKIINLYNINKVKRKH